MTTVLLQVDGAGGPGWWQWMTQPSLGSIATALVLVAVAAIIADIVAKQILLTTIGRMEFDLRVFQHPSGRDIERGLGRLSAGE